MLNFKIFLEMSPINIPKRGLYKKGSFDCLRPACNEHFYCCNWRFTDGKFMKESGKLFTTELTRNSRTPTSTLALRTPRYYRHPAIANKGPHPGETHKEMIEVNSRYYRHGNATLLCSQCEISLVFSLAIAGTTFKS